MKKFIAICLSILSIFISSATLCSNAYAEKHDEIKTFINVKGEKINYFENKNGDAYIIENGKKEYIAFPISWEKVTDEKTLTELRNEYKRFSVSRAGLPYIKNMNFSNHLDTTDVIGINGRRYVWMHCTNYNPWNAHKGMSFYMYLSYDGNEWIREQFVNWNLSIKKKVYVYNSGMPNMKIQMWSYYGDVNSCKLSIT